MSEIAIPTPAAGAVAAVETADRWKPAFLAAACFAGSIALNVLHVPGIASRWVPMFLLASGCMAALRWKRAGVRNELRSRAAARIAEFGGGVYGAIAMATALELEGADLVADVLAAGSARAFVDSLSLGWLISQAVESVKFAIQAGLWPWHWFSPYGMQAVLLAAGAACGLDALLRLSLPRYREMREAQQAAKARARAAKRARKAARPAA